MIAITLDIDWAPDFIIDWVANKLIKYNVKATWFVTHASPAIERLRQRADLFELGIHPNFLPGSTHGSSPDEVLNHCLKIVPEATSMRTHGLVQSTQLLLNVMAKTSIKVDVSLFLPHANYLQPIEYYWEGYVIKRVPYCWEDDFEMSRPMQCWCVKSFLNNVTGLKIVNFHPIHVYLNSHNLKIYNKIKEMYLSLADVPHLLMYQNVSSGVGAGSFFTEVVNYLSKSGQSKLIKNL